jgi:alginate O-acetyltransferase complex protein AlgI
MNFSNFTAPTFLFFFLPIVLTAYFATYIIFSLLASKRLGNVALNLVLLVASLIFYAEGERAYTLIMLFSITFNYVMGLLIDLSPTPTVRKLTFTASLAVNLGLLIAFKYSDFLVMNANHVLALMHIAPKPLPHRHLPIGISFFTFHALSYVTDVYRREVKPMRRFDSFALYITLFPQLIAGPIIRYKIICDQFASRVVTLEGFAEGVRRFVIGLGKKLIIADTVAYTADQIFSASHTAMLTPAVAWLGVICYTIQIYFDFSGYSDMAIGMGRMFGFVFPENFNYPYISQSITEFWRRWHMTLSSWFRDYLYIPLGGNRRGPARTYLNLMIVFFLCGLWHGATWSFVAWGMFHGAFLIVERVGLTQFLERTPRLVRHGYALLVVMVGWVFFNARDLSHALTYLEVMFGLRGGTGLEYNLALYLDKALVLALIAGIIGSTPIIPAVRQAWESVIDRFPDSRREGAIAGDVLWRLMSVTMTMAVFFGSAIMAAHGSYSPFIYYRF